MFRLDKQMKKEKRFKKSLPALIARKLKSARCQLFTAGRCAYQRSEFRSVSEFSHYYCRRMRTLGLMRHLISIISLLKNVWNGCSEDCRQINPLDWHNYSTQEISQNMSSVTIIGFQVVVRTSVYFNVFVEGDQSFSRVSRSHCSMLMFWLKLHSRLCTARW